MKTIRMMVLPVLLAVQGLAWGGWDEGYAAIERDDYVTALRELRPLAEQGNPDAALFLGIMYANGEGAPQDYKEAAKWYRIAAEEGAMGAQYNLAGMYFRGTGVPQDYKEAAKWYRRAAEQGVVEAQFSLGIMYTNGWGVLLDYVQAHKWYNIAGANGYEKGTSLRDEITGYMTPAQFAEAQKLAREWMEKHPYSFLPPARR